MHEILSVDQTAELLGLHPRTVRNYIRAGQLKAVKTGKLWRIRKRDIEELIDGSSGSSEISEPLPSSPKQFGSLQLELPEHSKADDPELDSRRTADRTGRMDVSAVVTIRAGQAPESVERITSSVQAVFYSRLPESAGARCDICHQPEAGEIRILLWGRIGFVSELLKLVAHIAEPQSEYSDAEFPR